MTAFNLILVKSAPYQGRRSFESVEAIMALALFDIPHRVVFIGDGISWVFSDHNTVEKSLEKQLKALPMYDSDDIYVCEEHLESVAQDVDILDFVEQVKEVTLADWIRTATQVEVF